MPLIPIITPMQLIADLHIHSKYSRACSQALTLENIAQTCQVKGVDIVATGDFTHPQWFHELKEKLVETQPGLYKLNPKFKKQELARRPVRRSLGEGGSDKGPLGSVGGTRFLCSTEISCIYSKGGKVRRLHIVVLAPNLEVVEKINTALNKIGNLKSDGRPILGLDSKRLAEICLNIDPRCMIIPAHIWTPWFAMFGSKSGFDSVQECFEELSDKIYAIETGLSSDPQMNWRVKNLDNISITSNSDAHSLPNIAREANVFNILENKISYDAICDVIKNNSHRNVALPCSGQFLYTIEFYPEEGMYHWDGHRICNISFDSRQSAKYNNICPVCKKPLTIGVMNRVQELAEPDRDKNYQDPNRVPFKKLIELDKIIAESLNIKSRSSKQVQEEYKNLIENFSNEFEILLNAKYEDLQKVTLPQIAEGIKRMRQGKVHITPGFDGQYGKIKIFDKEERMDYQKKLF